MTRASDNPSSAPLHSGFQQARCNRNTIMPQGYRDLSRELTAVLDGRLAELEQYFSEPVADELPICARLALLGTEELQTLVVPAQPAEFVCVGRHTEAGLRVEKASSLSLRHILLIPRQAVEAGEAEIQIDMVPLSPMVRLAAWPGELPPSLGSLCQGWLMGDALLLIAPTLSDAAASSLELRPSVVAGLSNAPEPAIVQHTLRARVTVAPSLFDVPLAPAQDAPLALEVRNGLMTVRLPIQETWLDRGVLLGRHPEKCSHSALAQVLAHEEVSRCHAFLRREGDTVVFYDTASTFGLQVGGLPVRRVAVPAPQLLAAGEQVDVSAIEHEINPQGIVVRLSSAVSVTLLANTP